MIKTWPGKTPEEQNEAMQRAFRHVFGTEEGTAVLNVILADLHYFTPCKTQDEVALNNYAKVLVTERMNLNDTVKYTDALLKCSSDKKGE